MSKLRYVFLLSGMLLFLGSGAQPNLYFINRAKHKIIEVSIGQQLSIKYKGYLGQTEFVKQTVTDINDSFVTLGVDPEMLGKGFQAMMSNNPKFIYRKVMIKDILAFRRITAGRQLLKVGLMMGNVAGSYYLLYNLYKKNDFSVGVTFLISFGVSVGTAVVINALLPENPKYQLNEGWEVITGFTRPK